MYYDYSEVLNCWIEDFEAAHPDMSLNDLQFEYENAIDASQNERIWALGSTFEYDVAMHENNMQMNLDYADWLDYKATELYGKALH